MKEMHKTLAQNPSGGGGTAMVPRVHASRVLHGPLKFLRAAGWYHTTADQFFFLDGAGMPRDAMLRQLFVWLSEEQCVNKSTFEMVCSRLEARGCWLLLLGDC